MEGRDARPLPPPNPAMPYRDDCWSEGATSALIDAWGDRFVELNRGNLRQKDWQEVADAVNSRRGGARRPARTDSQCKNRIDTLKKKYKAEKARIVDNGAGASQWPFYSRLETLIGASPATTTKKPPSHSVSPPFALPLPSHRKTSPLPSARPVEPPARAKRHAATIPTALPINDTLLRRNYPAAAAAAAAAAATAEEDSVSSASSSRDMSRSSSDVPIPRPAKRLRADGQGGGEDDGIRQLAHAITRFAEIYEKVEVEKQRQMMELEKQRMEFAKEMEFQRMQVFVDSQVQIEKMKRARGLDSGCGSPSAKMLFDAMGVAADPAVLRELSEDQFIDFMINMPQDLLLKVLKGGGTTKGGIRGDGGPDHPMGMASQIMEKSGL